VKPETALGDAFDIKLGDGGVIECLCAGPSGAMPLIFHVGTPMAAAPFASLVEAAARRGLSTVIYSRPGYGRSSRQRGHKIADVGGDVTAILGELRREDFVTLGWSGGGPRAIACAALLPTRCRAAICVAGVAPYRVSDLDWLAGMTAGNVAEYTAALRGEAALDVYLAGQSSRAAATETDDILKLLDREGITSSMPLARPFAEFVATGFRRSQSQGHVGWLDDDLAEIGDWGVDLTRIEVPVAIWHGRRDTYVPFAHGAWLGRHVPNAQTHFFDEYGHFSLFAMQLEPMLDEVVALGGL